MVSCPCEVGALSKRPIDGSDARYMSTDSGPRPVSIESSSVSAKEPGRSIGWSVNPGPSSVKPDDPGTYASGRVFEASDLPEAPACAELTAVVAALDSRHAEAVQVGAV